MNERLSYIDSLKGLAILFVLLLHSLSDGVRIAIWAPVHIGQAVPIFLAVTFFLSFLTMDKIGGSISEWFKLKRIKKMLRRVVLPFAVVLCIQCANLMYIGGFQPIIIVAGGGMVLVLIIFGYICKYGFLHHFCIGFLNGNLSLAQSLY